MLESNNCESELQKLLSSVEKVELNDDGDAVLALKDGSELHINSTHNIWWILDEKRKGIEWKVISNKGRK